MYFPGSRTLRSLAVCATSPLAKAWESFGGNEQVAQLRRKAIKAYIAKQSQAGAGGVTTDSERDWAKLTLELSESSGYFFSQNFVSNESEYLNAVAAIQTLPQGLAYLGVGPEPMLTYLGSVESPLAFVLDIRRDNARLHYLYRGLFATAKTRLCWLSLLLGRLCPQEREEAALESIQALLEHVSTLPKSEASFRVAHERIMSALDQMPPHLLPGDRTRLRQIHRCFFEHGLELTFQLGGVPLRRYPTLGRLLAEQTQSGNCLGFLAQQSTFARISAMQRASRVVPVVGAVTGPALTRIARELQLRKLRVGALYISNVEQYLFESGQWNLWVKKLSDLPLHEDAILIRSYFENSQGIAPDPPKTLLAQLKRSVAITAKVLVTPGPLPEHCMRTVVHRVHPFLERERRQSYANYRDLVSDTSITG